MRRFSSLCLLVATTVTTATLLSACGGGGDAAGLPPNTAYNAAAAWQNLLTTTHAWTASGTGSDGNNYRVSINIAPGGTAVFPVTGVTATKSNTNASIQRNGVTLATTLNETFFNSGFLELGERNTATGESAACDVSTSAALPSAAATISVSGSLSASNSLDGCASSSAVIGTTATTWSVEVHNGLGFFCTNATTQDTATPPNVSTEQDCIEMTADGTLGTHIRVTLTGSGQTIVMVN